jgi:hypothetical protein
MQAFGQIQQGRAAEAQAKSEQEILNFNARLKEREGEAQLERARAEARVFEREGEALGARQRVGFAKGGVLTAGTPALVLEETAQELEADRLQILREGFLARSFALSEAEGLRFSGRAARARGTNIKRASQLQAFGSILTGLGSVARPTTKSGTTRRTRRIGSGRSGPSPVGQRSGPGGTGPLAQRSKR